MKTRITDRRIFDYAEEKYNAAPEFLWKRTPDAAVLRHKDNRKWFALLMTVDPSKLGIDGERNVRIINVKCDPMMTGSLLMKDGYYPAYHMNKNTWISIILDGTVPEEEVFAAIDLSYSITV